VQVEQVARPQEADLAEVLALREHGVEAVELAVVGVAVAPDDIGPQLEERLSGSQSYV
jgi:hypothetical protein